MLKRVRSRGLLISGDEPLHLSPCKAPKIEDRSSVMLVSRGAQSSRQSTRPPISFFLAMFGLLFSLPARAQVAGGTLSGTITDPSGAAVIAEVEIKNIATGVERTVKTNTDGFYTSPNILPGEYQVTVTAKGFNKEIKEDVTIEVGEEQIF